MLDLDVAFGDDPPGDFEQQNRLVSSTVKANGRACTTMLLVVPSALSADVMIIA
jgi:hypothetical protein